MDFRFENASAAPLAVALAAQCSPMHHITSCADGYERPMALAAPCGTLCPHVPTCVSGACVPEPVPVTSSAPVSDAWAGYDHLVRSVVGGTCLQEVIAKPGRYRVEVPVYSAVPPTGADGGEPAALYTVSVDFTVPMPSGVVHVPVDRGGS